MEDNGRAATEQAVLAKFGLPRCHGTKDGARFSVRVIYFEVKAVEATRQRFLRSKVTEQRGSYEFREERTSS